MLKEKRLKASSIAAWTKLSRALSRESVQYGWGTQVLHARFFVERTGRVNAGSP